MSIFDRIGEAVVCCDGDGIVSLLNRAAAVLFRCDPADGLGQPLSLFFDGAEEVLRQGVPTQAYQLHARRGDGSCFSARIYADYRQSASNDGFVLTIHPLPEPVNKAQDSARLAAIIESSDDAIIGKTLDGIITSWNKGAERIFGYTADELIGQPISKLIPPGRETEEPGILERLRSGKRVDHFDTLRVARGGRLVDVSLTISPIRDESGVIVGASKIARDITEQKRVAAAQADTEQRMRLAVDAAKLGFWDWDVQAKTMIRSPMLAKLMGATEVQGQYDLSSVNVHPDDQENTRLKLNDALTTGNEYVNEFRTIRADGSIHWLEARGRATYDDQGNALRMLGIVVDISGRKAAEEQARLRDAELVHLSRISTMGNMASGLAHELNQPLCAILNYTGVCQTLSKSSPLPVEKFREALEEVMIETRRAAAIISRLRSFVTKQAPRSFVMDLNEMVRKSVALLGYEIRQQGLRTKLDLCVGSTKVRVDAIQIEQVIVNLIYNAMQAMSQAPVADQNLIVQTNRTADDLAEVLVIDSGPGIAPENLPRLFQPFFTTKPQGMGMGLNISRSIIENHAGRLSASINPTGGMTFRFTLPIG